MRCADRRASVGGGVIIGNRRLAACEVRSIDASLQALLVGGDLSEDLSTGAAGAAGVECDINLQRRIGACVRSPDRGVPDILEDVEVQQVGAVGEIARVVARSRPSGTCSDVLANSDRCVGCAAAGDVQRSAGVNRRTGGKIDGAEIQGVDNAAAGLRRGGHCKKHCCADDGNKYAHDYCEADGAHWQISGPIVGCTAVSVPKLNWAVHSRPLLMT